MELSRALEIITLLSDGINPKTGEIFDYSSPYQNPDVIRALYISKGTLERVIKNKKRERKLPRNAGINWSKEEEIRLINSFDTGATIAALAKQHERTEVAIRSRLIKLGKITQY